MKYIIIILTISLIGCSSTKKKSQAPKKVSAEENLSEIISAIKEKGGPMERFVIDDMYLKASHASIRGDVKTAIIYWEKIQLLKSDDAFINKKYAVDLIRSGNLVKAKMVLEKIDKESMPNRDGNLAMVLAGLYVSTGEKDKAKNLYKYLVEKQNNSEACIFLGRFYAEEKKYKKANKILLDCENKNKKKAIFAYFRGKIAMEQKKVKLAKRHYKRGLKLEPGFQEAVIQLGKLYESEGDLKRAERVYKKFLENSPDNFAVLQALVKTFFSQGVKTNIIPYVEKLSSLDTENLNLKVRLGILYSDAKRYESAIGVFSEILKVVPTSEKIMYYLASLYQELNNPDKALENFLKVPETGALFKDSQVQVAKIYNEKSFTDGKENKEYTEKLIKFVNERSLKYPNIEFELKIVLVGHYETARNFVEAVKLMETLKGNKQFREEHDYYLASLLDKDNRFADARAILENLLKKNPNNPHALNFLAYSFIEKDIEMDQAFKLLKRAISLKPNDGYIRDSLGWYYYKTGDLKKALAELKKAWQREKSDVVITKHLAIIYQDLKRYRMAEKYFSEALKNCKQDNERMEVLQAMENLEKIRLVDTPKRLPASE
jgi:tetratricopeptide (TPR) repeat protein